MKLISPAWGKRKVMILKDKEKLPNYLTNDVWFASLIDIDSKDTLQINNEKWKLVESLFGFNRKFELYRIK
jgi:hypothetical protein